MLDPTAICPNCQNRYQPTDWTGIRDNKPVRLVECIDSSCGKVWWLEDSLSRELTSTKTMYTIDPGD